MDQHKERDINTNGLILLWAFSESGIGGILHALKLPFTGIFVGGIAIICISLMSYYTNDRSNILKALGIVLLVKFTVSPHSPWQAYIAVIFQGLLGYILFKNNTNFKLKCFTLGILGLLESAIQKVLLMILIYGTTFMKALDSAAKSIAQIFGITEIPSLVFTVFGLYIFLHLIGGILLGFWIPSIPKRLWTYEFQVFENEILHPKSLIRKGMKALFVGFAFLALILVALKFILPEMPASTFLFIFVRSLVLSVGLIFLIGPLIKSLIYKYTTKNTEPNQLLFKQIMDEIPYFTGKAIALLEYINTTYSGPKKIKLYVLGLLQMALKYKS